MADATAVDVLVVGDLNPDLIVSRTQPTAWGEQVEHDADIVMALGGSGGICAAGLAKLGLRTALCAAVGDDDLGTAVRRLLISAGVHIDAVDVLPGRRTGISVHVLAEDDRTIYTDRGALVDLRVAEALRWMRDLKPRHVHLCSLYLIPELVSEGGRVVDAAHAMGATISLDTNFDPAGRFVLPHWARRVDLLMPNETEALGLAGPTHGGDLGAAGRDLSSGGALVAIKCGARGAIGLHGTQYVQVGVGRASTVVDTVGAGDSFDAGLIRAVLAARDLSHSLAFACACGTLSTRGAGGTGAQATLAEALEFMDSVPDTADVR